MPEIVDRAVLESLLQAVGDDPDFLAEVVDVYLEDAPHQLAGMRRAALAGAAGDLVMTSHTLKGTSLNVGAAALAELCRVVEHRARAGDLEGCGPLIDQAEDAFRATADALAEARAAGWQAS